MPQAVEDALGLDGYADNVEQKHRGVGRVADGFDSVAFGISVDAAHVLSVLKAWRLMIYQRAERPETS